MTFEGFKDDQFQVLAYLVRKNNRVPKYTMFWNDTLYQSQEISPIFEISQSESLHHFWWEFPPASLWEAWHPFNRPGLPLSYLKRLQMGGGGTMGQFCPWPRFISIIDNTDIFYTSYAYLLLDPIGSLDVLGILCLFVWLISQIQHHISSYPLIQVNSGVSR